MKLRAAIKMIAICLVIVIIVFIVVSLLDILIAVFYSRFYTNVAFIISFGVGGIFGAVLAFFSAIPLASEKNEQYRWTLIITLMLTGCIFFLLLARLEEGEYEAAFKAYGATLALGSLLFVKGKID